MALVCQHDHVLWLVNMTSAGEKQVYALVALKTLFQHLLLSWKVGALYDVMCILECSCRLWGFLECYIDRLTFAVSVFHAFGHGWPFQLIYHPHECIGYGFSDGESCERLWQLISSLMSLWCKLFLGCITVVILTILSVQFTPLHLKQSNLAS